LNVLIVRHYKQIVGKVGLDPSELSVYATEDGRLLDMMQKNSKTGEYSVNAENLVEAMRYMYTEYREMKDM
jgi:hypothetical protein